MACQNFGVRVQLELTDFSKQYYLFLSVCFHAESKIRLEPSQVHTIYISDLNPLLLFAVPDLFVDSCSDCLWGLPNDDQRLEDGCAYNLRHRLLDCCPFCLRFPFRSRRQFTPTIWVSQQFFPKTLYTRLAVSSSNHAMHIWAISCNFKTFCEKKPLYCCTFCQCFHF